jgi:hypothetical protein
VGFGFQARLRDNIPALTIYSNAAEIDCAETRRRLRWLSLLPPLRVSHSEYCRLQNTHVVSRNRAGFERSCGKGLRPLVVVKGAWCLG